MIAAWLLLTLTTAPAGVPPPTRTRQGTTTRQGRQDADAAIRQVVRDMEAAWNRGDFRGYMAAFADPGVTFVSGGRIQDGWQGTLDHYVRDYGGSAERRGRVRFWDLKIDVLAPDAAMLVGRYRLERSVARQEGINTRLFRRIDGRWVITMNHVSSFLPAAG